MFKETMGRPVGLKPNEGGQSIEHGVGEVGAAGQGRAEQVPSYRPCGSHAEDRGCH